MTEEDIKVVLNKYDKRQWKWNIIKFLIWLGLLALSWWYIQNHPAERVSVFSGFDVLWQEVEIFFHNTFKWNWDLLERKYGLEKYYKELLNMAEWNECLSSDDYNTISQAYEDLKATSNDVLNETLPKYIESAYKFEALVQDEDC